MTEPQHHGIVFGQFMVALVFAEAASHYPLAGGVYQWAKHLANGAWGWFTAWMFLFALMLSVAGVAFGAAPRLEAGRLPRAARSSARSAPFVYCGPADLSVSAGGGRHWS